MPKASHKTKGGDKDSAVKNTFNPPAGGGHESQTPGPQERDPEHRQGQFGDAGNPPLMKK